MLAFALRQDFDFPAGVFRVARVHAKQVACEDRRLVTPGSRADFEEHVAVVEGVGRNQRLLQIKQQLLAPILEPREFFLSHLPHFFVGVLRHFLGGGDIVQDALVFLEGPHHRLDARVFPREIAKLVLIGNDVRVGQQAGDFLEAVADGL